MKEIKILALSGFIGSGKDHIAKILEERFGYLHLKLAGLIKLNYCLIHGITLEQLEERERKEVARPYLIELGEKMKEVDIYTHCKYVYNQILFNLPEKTKIVVSDCRYPYESLYFKKLERCSQCLCEVDYQGFKDYTVNYKSLYVQSNLANNSSNSDSESHYESYLKPSSDGIIINNQSQRYDRENESLVNQLIKFI